MEEVSDIFVALGWSICVKKNKNVFCLFAGISPQGVLMFMTPAKHYLCEVSIALGFDAYLLFRVGDTYSSSLEPADLAVQTVFSWQVLAGGGWQLIFSTVNRTHGNVKRVPEL